MKKTTMICDWCETEAYNNGEFESYNDTKEEKLYTDWITINADTGRTLKNIGNFCSVKCAKKHLDLINPELSKEEKEDINKILTKEGRV